MKKLAFLVFLAVFFAATSLQAQASTLTAPPDASQVKLTSIVNNLFHPLGLYGAGDGTDRLFIVEQNGKIRVMQAGKLLTAPFLDIHTLVSPSAQGTGYSEQGLLSMAFSPNYKTDGRFYIDYTDVNGNTVVARYKVSSSDPNVADPSSAVTILTQKQPYPNHNGGQLAFGPDGYLYVSFGDGGSEGDPQGNGQNLGTWLGKILRIDVSGDQYTVPPDNPFVNQQGALPEIWAYGLRNPWHFSFDRKTGDLWIGDVGQDKWEEVDFQPAGDKGGENYGWSIDEATHPYSGAAAPANLTMPVAEYSHQNGIAVMGGYVYRGTKIPALDGYYFYGDYGFGTVWSLYKDANGQWQSNVFMSNVGPISAFGQDDEGELYLVNYGGYVSRFDPAS
ncbi:MAG TPA: PQQ-dependent sugar dehydrogenase [Phototrophicaceae bacterium]|nr:PQQ-dependent sugar dehydrogenase [Phototrophicaceae bacterium]